MLGKLSTCLFILGFNTLYSAHDDLSLLISPGLIEKRVPLTKNARISRKKDLPGFLLI